VVPKLKTRHLSRPWPTSPATWSGVCTRCHRATAMDRHKSYQGD